MTLFFIIKNPIFDECAKLTFDPFWISLFRQASLGKFPRGFLFMDTSLIYKRGARTSRVDLAHESPADAMTAAMAFFTASAGIMSEADQIRTRKELEAKNTNVLSIQNCAWSQIKKEKVREILLATFVNEIVVEYKLSDAEKRQLETLIHIGFFLGYFQVKHVLFSEGRVYGIDGLNFDTAQRLFLIDPSLTPKVTKSTAKKTGEKSKVGVKKCFANQWEKFVQKYERTGLAPISA